MDDLPGAARAEALADRLALHAWLSASFPVGAFAYSHGLETAIAQGRVARAAELSAWCAGCLAHGAGRTDAILLAAAYRAPHDPEPADLARALCPSAERRLETEALGAAFADMVQSGWGTAVAPAPYPVAIGRAAAARGLGLPATAALFLQAFVANLVSVGVRLVPLGQTDGQRILARLTPEAARLGEEAATASLDAIGGLAIGADIASMRHETLEPRIFRT